MAKRADACRKWKSGQMSSNMKNDNIQHAQWHSTSLAVCILYLCYIASGTDFSAAKAATCVALRLCAYATAGRLSLSIRSPLYYPSPLRQDGQVGGDAWRHSSGPSLYLAACLLFACGKAGDGMRYSLLFSLTAWRHGHRRRQKMDGVATSRHQLFPVYTDAFVLMACPLLFSYDLRKAGSGVKHQRKIVGDRRVTNVMSERSADVGRRRWRQEGGRRRCGFGDRLTCTARRRSMAAHILISLFLSNRLPPPTLPAYLRSWRSFSVTVMARQKKQKRRGDSLSRSAA